MDNTENREGRRTEARDIGSRPQPETPSSPKRRRLRSNIMRLDQDFSTSNGSRPYSNGSPHSNHKPGLPSSTNGHSSSANGTSSPHRIGIDGSSPIARTKTSDFFGHDREEVTRLLIQGLGDLGYPGAAERLCHESGYEVETPIVAAFRDAVLQGEWSEAESFLFGLNPSNDGGGVSISNGHSHEHHGLRLIEGANRDELKFRLREQKYLELLEKRDLSPALIVLRQELTPLNQDTGKLHNLSRYTTRLSYDADCRMQDHGLIIYQSNSMPITG